MICHFPLRSRFRHSFSLCATGRFLGRILFAFFFICTLAGCKGTASDAQDKVPADTASFPSFLVDVFQEYAASDSLSLHYTLQNPELLQITEPEITLGHFGKDTLLAGNRTATDYLDRLHSFSRDTLSPSEQFLYDLLEYTFINSRFPEEAVLYDSPLGPTTGLQTQLPVLLAEYRFYTIEDVENYFLLLQGLPNYFEELCEFERLRSSAGAQSCNEVLERILLQCNSFVEDPGNNFLIESFKDRLTSLTELTAPQIASLCMENQRLVLTKVIPAYELLIETLTGLLDESVSPKGLCSLPSGTAYYEYLVRNLTGSDRNIEELEAMLTQALTDNMLTMITLYNNKELQEELKLYLEQGLHLQETSDTTINTLSSPSADRITEYSSEVLSALRKRITADFPAPADVSCDVRSVHPSLEDFISPALFLVPPLDAYTENIIYINKAKCSGESLFSTLAHEGYPGHLYQNTYFAATNPHPVRMLLNFTGYDEGWGTYAELYSYQYANCSEALRQFLAAEQIAGLCLYSLSDVRIHYHGASLEAIQTLFEKYGISAESAEEIFYTQLAEPAVYLPYSVGYLELTSLREQYYKLAGENASLLPFHTFLLEMGPAPFSLLEEHLQTAFSPKVN